MFALETRAAWNPFDSAQGGRRQGSATPEQVRQWGICEEEASFGTHGVGALAMDPLLQIMPLLSEPYPVARASSPAGSRTVPVRLQKFGGETPPELAGEDACATIATRIISDL